MNLLLAAVLLLQDKSVEELLQLEEAVRRQQLETANNRKNLGQLTSEGIIQRMLLKRNRAFPRVLQDKSAEETFKKLEETIEKAKTVNVKYQLKGSSPRGQDRTTYTAEGSLLLKGDARISA